MNLFLLRYRRKIRCLLSFFKLWYCRLLSIIAKVRGLLISKYSNSTVFIPVLFPFFYRFIFNKQRTVSQQSILCFRLRYFIIKSIQLAYYYLQTSDLRIKSQIMLHAYIYVGYHNTVQANHQIIRNTSTH